MKYSIDRFEGGTAVLLDGKTEVHIPRKALPPSAKPGCIVERTDTHGWMVLVDETQDHRLRLIGRRKKLLEDRS